jgi:dienelactone hydrolase
MRTFELLLWTTAAAWLAVRIVRPAKPIANLVFGSVAAVLVVVHTTIEGARFHMVPTYMIAAALAAGSIPRAERRASASCRRRLVLAVPFLAAVVVSGLLPSWFPVFTYDEPTGQYAIGTAIYRLGGAPDRRELVIQAWYPAAGGTKGVRAGITTHPRLLETAYASFTSLPRPLFDNLRLVRTHAIVDAPMTRASERFPVVLFSHGPLGGNRSQSVFQMEALASHGFVTIAIDHTGYASTTIFPDGHQELPGPNASWPVFVDGRSTAMLKAWVGDVRFVIDRLEELDRSDASGQLAHRLDLNRLGYVGASFGGSVVVQSLLDEPRIKAGVAEDGKPYFLDNTLTDLKRPLMYMQSAAPYIPASDAQLARWGLTSARFKVAEQDHYTRQMQLFGRANGPIFNVFIKGTNHVTFSDLNLILALPDSTLMDVRRAHRIINDYTVAFFDRYLNGVPNRLVDGQSAGPYPEVTVASRHVDDGRLGQRTIGS